MADKDEQYQGDKWEFEAIRYRYDGAEEQEADAEIRKMSANGWELVSVIQPNYSNSNMREFYFKRRIIRQYNDVYVR